MTPANNSFRSLVVRWWDTGAGIVIAVLFWFLIGVIAIAATAQSEKRWDTLIAALAMGSQAFFAAAVWKLSKNQFAYTQQVSERQHKIDMYPLRKAAALNLYASAKALDRPHQLSDDHVEAFRACHMEIKNLFSDQAEAMAFELYQLVEQAHILFLRAQPKYDDGGSISEPADEQATRTAHNCLDNAYDAFTDLENRIDEEMRIR